MTCESLHSEGVPSLHPEALFKSWGNFHRPLCEHICLTTLSASGPKYPLKRTILVTMNMTPEPVHKTPAITCKDFQAGYMKPTSYSGDDISKAIVHLVGHSEDELTVIQLRGIDKLRSYGVWNIYEPENLHDLKTYFDIFNDVFFNGVLAGYCTMSFFSPRGGETGTSAYCLTQYPEGSPRDPRHVRSYQKELLLSICFSRGDPNPALADLTLVPGSR